jgi:hypothetical protein
MSHLAVRTGTLLAGHSLLLASATPDLHLSLERSCAMAVVPCARAAAEWGPRSIVWRGKVGSVLDSARGRGQILTPWCVSCVVHTSALEEQQRKRQRVTARFALRVACRPADDSITAADNLPTRSPPEGGLLANRLNVDQEAGLSSYWGNRVTASRTNASQARLQ